MASRALLGGPQLSLGVRQSIITGGRAMDIKRYLVITTVSMVLSSPIVLYAGNVPPFTKDAGEKIKKIYVESGNKYRENGKEPPDIEKDPITGTKFMIEHSRNVYREAGYDYDATICAVAEHIKSNMGKDNNAGSVLRDKNLENTPFSQIIESIFLVTAFGGPNNFSNYFEGNTLDSVKYIYDVLSKMK